MLIRTLCLLTLTLTLAGCAVQRTTESKDGFGGTKKSTEMQLAPPILWRADTPGEE